MAITGQKSEKHRLFNTLQLFRPLFPSWRFFEDVTEIPIMFYRAAPAGGEFGEWQPVLKVLKRRWSNLFINPSGNLNLAAHSLLQQLEIELGEVPPEQAESFETSVAFELAKNLACYSALEDARRLDKSIRPAQLQFKIGRILQGAPISGFEQFIQSQVFAL